MFNYFHWIRSSFRFAAFALALAACAQHVDRASTHGIVLANLDRVIKPGDNFNLYANGAWIKRAVIPPDRSSISPFDRLLDLTDKRTLSIIEEQVKANGPAGSNGQKIADLYRSYMNQARIESRGLAPITPGLKAIAAITNKTELAHTLGESLRADVDPLNNTNFHTPNLFGMWVAPGFADSAHYAPYLLQGGLELPDRDYYLSDTESMRTIRTKYQVHIVTMLRLAGLPDAEGRAARIFALELALAKIHESLADNQEVEKANNPWQRKDFPAKAPGLDWAEYFRGAGLSQTTFIVWQPAAFAGEAGLVHSVPLDAWKDWLAYHLIEDYADALPAKLADEHFALMGKLLSGTPQQRPRWQRGVTLENSALGEAIGPIYAQRYFPPQAKAEVEALVGHIIDVYRERLKHLT